jgi:hypothetical protein
VSARRKVVLGLAVGIALIGLCGGAVLLTVRWLTPDPPDPTLTSEVVVGRWAAPAGATFSFHLDGTFEASNLPRALLGQSVPGGPTGSADGAGTWAVEQPGQYVQLVFRMLGDETAAHAVPVYVHYRDGQPVLYLIRGDPDLNNLYEFSRSE